MTAHESLISSISGGILCDSEICKIAARNNGEPLSPFFSTQRKIKINDHFAPSFGLGPATYDIRLGYNFRTYIDFSATVDQAKDYHNVIDISNPDTLLTDSMTLAQGEFYDLSPGAFVLAQALEYFKIPRDLVAIVSDKSTWARCGLAVQNTVVDPGFEGDLTLELSNHNFRPIRLYPGVGIAQIHFHRVLGRVRESYGDRNNGTGGKYQYQSGVTPPR